MLVAWLAFLDVLSSPARGTWREIMRGIGMLAIGRGSSPARGTWIEIFYCFC